MWARWYERRGNSIFWRKTASVAAAQTMERKWNQYDNPYDYLVLLEVRQNPPAGLRDNGYGSLMERSPKRPIPRPR